MSATTTPATGRATRYTVQGNILENADTLDAMAATFEETDGGLPERLSAALHAGNAAGGDERGEQSAALYVAKTEGGDASDALETFRGMNNFENHSLAALEDAIAWGWDATEPDACPEKRLVDAIRYGLSRLDRV
jgi:hypothetical protein